MADLLLHSLKEFDQILFALLERMRPRSILEIGSESGEFSARLLRSCEERGARLEVVEPCPAPHLLETAADSDVIHLYVGYSLDYLRQERCRSELVLIDGDHNYFTVLHELRLIDDAWREQGMAGAVIVHDVGFPWGRRDLYYDPDAIPEDARHPYSFDKGVTLDRPELIEGGFRSLGAFAFALHEGGPKNGVLTAVEDFLRERPGYSYRAIDAVFGLGAITTAGSEAEKAVVEVFAAYDNELIRRLERNRLELYLKVLELQDALAAHAARGVP